MLKFNKPFSFSFQKDAQFNVFANEWKFFLLEKYISKYVIAFDKNIFFKFLLHFLKTEFEDSF